MKPQKRTKVLQEKRYIIGADPGLKGALAVVCPYENKLITLMDMPLSGNKIDSASLSLSIKPYLEKTALVVIEDVHAMPKQGVVSMFSFGVSKGILLGILSFAQCPILLPPPSVWKMALGLSSSKDDSRKVATEMFPSHSSFFERKKDDGRAEAVLLAHFGRRYYHS